MTRAQACAAHHSGQCDADVLSLSRQPAIPRQLRRIDPGVLASELEESGAWDDAELSDHPQNLQRFWGGIPEGGTNP